ncbi:EscU/YscU/HrcU family type III secretion system export apparatus switch protein [Fictibacillus aquaticus]|uniref:Type III secretion system protein n=1 Tax=Fictibacillus aquaticus TaxID=2021314 RepID=A0A235FBW0_9BACL|nr:EscU/YscU/HrcU family type III secretion system export apparatus switch protein [Fictibacillus aquaticus]OYD58870.1 hypothetical protein CGZ90_02925 [Fictibacillus aquaticus]
MNNDRNKLKAVAMKYKNGMNEAPVVIAKGNGAAAEKIMSIAKEHDIPVQKDPSLVHLLSKLDISSQIPPELFEAVAEVFAYIYKLDKEAKEKTLKN